MTRMPEAPTSPPRLAVAPEVAASPARPTTVEEELAQERAHARALERRFALLKGISEVALADEEPALALDDIVRRVRQELPACCVTLLLRDSDSDVLRVRTSDRAAGAPDPVCVRGGQSLSGRIVATGRPVLSDEMPASEAGETPVARGARSAGVPLIKGSRVLGVLEVVTGETLDAEDVHLLEAVAVRLVAVLDRQRSLDAERRARAQAEAALRQRDEVLAIVAHDLRNPLNRISLGASVLRESLGPAADPRPWELMQRGVRDMDRLIQDPLDVSRLEAGDLQMERSQQPLAPLMEEVQEEFAALARSRGLAFSCRADPSISHVLADRRRLVQALSNLIDNALRLTPAGGTVAVEARPAPGYVEFIVRDTGPGIPAEHLPHLFDRFWQGARARRGGAGLGLAIVKGIVEAHGGRLFAENAAGKGAVFRFWIPTAA
jgi:signal transduction histidine kinase